MLSKVLFGTIAVVSANHGGLWSGEVAYLPPGASECVVETAYVKITGDSYFITIPANTSAVEYQFFSTTADAECDELTNSGSDVTSFAQHKIFSDTPAALVLQETSGAACLPISACSAANPTIRRFQLCKVGQFCVGTDAISGQVTAGGWFAGNGGGNVTYASTSRILLAVFGILVVIGGMAAFYFKKDLIGEKMVAFSSNFSGKSAQGTAYQCIGVSFVVFLLVTISCGAPEWSVANGAKLGPWSVCPLREDCTELLAGGNTGEATSAVIMVRMFSLVAQLLSTVAVAIPLLVALEKIESAKAIYSATAHLLASGLLFFAVCAWSAFHNDVLGPDAAAKGYDLAYGFSFHLGWLGCILSFAAALFHYGLRSAEQAAGGAVKL